MVGVVVATHGPLASSIVESGALIMGQCENVQCLGLYHGDSIEEFEDKVLNAVSEADTGEGVLILTDLLGGSPCNMAAKAISEFSETKKIDCLYGVNLPVFLEIMNAKNHMKFDELLVHAKGIFSSTYGVLSSKLEY